MKNDFFAIYIATFIFSLLLSYLLVFLIINLARRNGWIEKPNHRTVHNGTIPWGGGIAIYFSFLFSMILALLLEKNIKMVVFLPNFIKIMIPSTIIFIMGFIDDHKKLRAHYKFITEIIAGLILYALGIRIEINNILVSLSLTIFWVVFITNAINLIDGLDGLAAGIIAIASLVLFFINQILNQPVISLIYIALFGCSLGFLKHNFHPAKVFMGDCGSLFLGFLLGSTTIFTCQESTSTRTLFIPMIVLGIPLVDTGWAIIRRLKNHQGIFSPDKNHIHHQLLKAVFSHKKAVIIFYAITILLGGIAFYSLAQ